MSVCVTIPNSKTITKHKYFIEYKKRMKNIRPMWPFPKIRDSFRFALRDWVNAHKTALKIDFKNQIIEW